MLAKPRDAVSFAQAVRDLFAQDWQAMGLAARLRVDRQFRWNVVFERQHTFYQALQSGIFKAEVLETAHV